MQMLERIESLYLSRGHRVGEDIAGAPFSALAHALQAAQLAEHDDAGIAMIAAALLHDVGQLIPLPADSDGCDDGHERRAAVFLADAFGDDVVQPIRLHVQAKRYLVQRDAGYLRRLSASSANALAVQGGAMTDRVAAAFENLPYAADAVQLRLYDDRAKVPGLHTPGLDHYLQLLARYHDRRALPRHLRAQAPTWPHASAASLRAFS